MTQRGERPSLGRPQGQDTSWSDRAQGKAASNTTSVLVNADVWIVHNDWPEWRTLTAKDFAPVRRQVVIDGRRILRGEVV